VGKVSLPKRKPKDESAERRWRGPAHIKWMTDTFACAMCGSTTNVVGAHVRKGSICGTGLKPDDFRVVPLCDGPYANIHRQLGCHNRQHIVGEDTFWQEYRDQHGQTVDELLASLCKSSPKSADIAKAKRERGL
jgi:hypothetical protein